MRTSEEVTFLKITKGHYNPSTKKEESVIKESLKVYANITNLTIEKTMELFGSLEIDAKTVRLLNTTIDSKQFNFIEINKKRYVIIKQIKARNHMSFIVKEV